MVRACKLGPLNNLSAIQENKKDNHSQGLNSTYFSKNKKNLTIFEDDAEENMKMMKLFTKVSAKSVLDYY